MWSKGNIDRGGGGGGGVSVQLTAGSWDVCISGSNAGYTMFRGSVKGTGYPLHSPISPSLALPCVTMFHHISAGVYKLEVCLVLILYTCELNRNWLWLKRYVVANHGRGVDMQCLFMKSCDMHYINENLWHDKKNVYIWPSWISHWGTIVLEKHRTPSSEPKSTELLAATNITFNYRPYNRLGG